MAFDTADPKDTPQEKDAGQEAADAAHRLSPAGIAAMQGQDAPPPDQPDASFHAQTATTELGNAMRAETGPEKPEVRIFHDVAKPESEEEPSPYREGRI